MAIRAPDGAKKKQVLTQADVLLPIEAPGEEINVTKVIHRPGNHAIT